MNQLAFYMHAGSGNHGCEALVESLTRLVTDDFPSTASLQPGKNQESHSIADEMQRQRGAQAGSRPKVSGMANIIWSPDDPRCDAATAKRPHPTLPQGEKITLMTHSAAEDRQYLPMDVQRHLDIEQELDIAAKFAVHAFYYAKRKITRDDELFQRYTMRAIAARRPSHGPKEIREGKLPRLAISIGGDNYCYPSMLTDLMRANRMLNRQGTKTILLGCSIEPEILQQNQAVVADMNRYQKIVARESITRRALLDAGIPSEKVCLAPDPAFALPKDETGLPPELESGNTVGINLSPMALDYAADQDAVRRGYVRLIQHILDTTNMKVALIPHVVWQRSNDREPLTWLLNQFPMNARIFLVQDTCAEKLKGIIANCRFFIGARTHATIAAYSSLVPTLVIGYSVKARGIAQDLFGQTAHYVLPVQVMRNPDDLIAEFDWLYRHEDQIHYDLAGAIPLYLEQVHINSDVVLNQLNC